MNNQFIRTENGIFALDESWDMLLEDMSIKKRIDTLEELCDEFVIKAYISSYPQIYHSVDLKELNEFREKDTIVYGAIWTDKGLIFVARMNNEGVLELL